MQRLNKKSLKEFYEKEAEHLAHQEMMYLRGSKHELWWHRKRLVYVISFLSEIFEKNQIITFADIGCAEGFYVKYVSSVYTRTFCLGVDIARAYVKKAKISDNRLNTEYIVCDIENLPFQDNSIDVVLCSEVLEHVPNYKGALAEILRIGKKYLVISFPGHSYIYKVISKMKPLRKLADKLAPEVGHVSEVKVESVQELVRSESECLKIKIGGALPIQLYKIIPLVRLVEVIDNMLCAALKYIGIVESVTIHVMELIKN